MNETAKKLREAAHHMSGNTLTLVQVIRQVREKLDVEETDTFGGDLVAILIAIADELDELQARAAGANNLRQQLESAEDKAERRKKHIGYLDTALHDKNALLEQRGLTIARLTTDNSELRKLIPTERERQILALWPRFEDGEYVMVGDRFIDHKVNERTVRSVIVNNDGVELRTFDGTFDWHETGERVKRPAPNDSWERFVEDMQKSACAYFGYQHKECDEGDGCPASGALDCSNRKMADLIRRAKALAGVEVDE